MLTKWAQIGNQREPLHNNKYPKNTINNLLNKKVYSNEGEFVGIIKEVIFENNKIHSLKIRLKKGHNLKSKGIIINYKDIK